MESACAASCAAQEGSACGDPYCNDFCAYFATGVPACEEEFIEQQECWGELEGSDFDCATGYPFPIAPACADEEAAFVACASG